MVRILLLCLLLVSCTKEKPLPKVGDCFEVFLEQSMDKNSTLYEIRKVIKVDPKSKYDTISYVYNFPNDPKFQKGKWYSLEPLTTTSRYWFFQEFQDFESIKPIGCPW